MNLLQQLILEQYEEYAVTIKDIEADIISKHRKGEDPSLLVTRVFGLKALQKECLLMFSEKATE